MPKGKSKSAKKKAVPVVADTAPQVKFKYLCPACTGIAIESSNQMMGVKVTCERCGKDIMLDDATRWLKIRK